MKLFSFSPAPLLVKAGAPFKADGTRNSTAAVFLNNAVITAGLILLNWQLSDAVLIFWIEGIIAGIFGCIKVSIRSFHYFDMPDEGPVFRTVTVLLFSVMYMALIFVMVFITALFMPLFINAVSDRPVINYSIGTGSGGMMSGLMLYLKDRLFVSPASPGFYGIAESLKESRFILLINILLSQALIFRNSFIKNRRYLTENINRLIVRPTAGFFMIYILLGVVFLPFAKAVSWNSEEAAVIIWMTAKTFFDLYGGYIEILVETGS